MFYLFWLLFVHFLLQDAYILLFFIVSSMGLALMLCNMSYINHSALGAMQRLHEASNINFVFCGLFFPRLLNLEPQD